MKNKIIAASILSISSFIGGLFLASAKVAADSIVDRVVVSVPVSCTMSGAIENGEEHSAEIHNGTYQSDIGITTMTMFCNDGEGFSVYAVGYTDGEHGNTTLTNSNLSSSYSIATGTATSGNTSNWAMKLSTDSTATYPVTINNGFDSYSAVPSTYTKVATSESNTDIGVQGASFTTTYSAYINSTQLAGTYTGQVKYTLVHPSIEIPAQAYNTEPGYIAYYPNTNTATGTMGRQSLASTDTSATLLASNFSRAKYGFAGWNTAYDYSGDFYGPNETITFEPGQYTDGDSGLSLYAVWVESKGLIQDWSGCSSLAPVSYDGSTAILSANLSNVTALTDLRDNQTYAVARLADGDCWMVENLRLSSEGSRSASSSSLSQGYAQSGIYGNFIGLAGSENNYFSNSTSSNTIYGTSNDSTININTANSPSSRLPRYNDTNVTNRDIAPNGGSAKYYSYGNYYNWTASKASTNYYSSRAESNLANSSLCPSGWRLPYGSDTQGGEYDNDIIALDKAMGGGGVANSVNAVSGVSMSHYWRKFPNNLVYSGAINGSSVNSRGGEGYLWTTTIFSDEKSYGLSINNSYINPGINSYQKYYGFSVRCISS